MEFQMVSKMEIASDRRLGIWMVTQMGLHWVHQMETVLAHL